MRDAVVNVNEDDAEAAGTAIRTRVTRAQTRRLESNEDELTATHLLHL